MVWNGLGSGELGGVVWCGVVWCGLVWGGVVSYLVVIQLEGLDTDVLLLAEHHGELSRMTLPL